MAVCCSVGGRTSRARACGIYQEGSSTSTSTLLAALERELLEETGLAVEPTEFLGIWMQPTTSIVWCFASRGSPGP